ncbi:sulfite exporter TauE/SafE family protein [Pasteurellaceae bacterium 22721_9_1]
MALTTLCILIVCGIIVNMVSALFGIGGGVLMVPILRTLFPQFPIQMVAATSLTIVMASSLINLLSFRRQHIQIDIKSLLFWSLGMVIGVQLGFELSFLLSDLAITLVFTITLTLLALKTLFIKSKANLHQYQANAKERIYGALTCASGGFVAGITGIGGGSIMAPLVAQLKSVQTKQIAVYTNYMMVIGGIGNLYGYLSKSAVISEPIFPQWQYGYVNFAIVGIVTFSSFLTSFFSMKLRGKLSPHLTTKLLGVILLLIASYTFILQMYFK